MLRNLSSLFRVDCIMNKISKTSYFDEPDSKNTELVVAR
jgi:hypothetical protein